MTEFDVLAVRGAEEETIHVEVRGTVPNGTRTDGPTGQPVEVIGTVTADNADEALSAACRFYL